MGVSDFFKKGEKMSYNFRKKKRVKTVEENISR